MVPRIVMAAVTVVMALLASCTPADIRCASDATCPTSAPSCVAGTCKIGEGEGEGSAGRGGEGEGGEGERGEGEGGEGEGGEGEGEGDCRVGGCGVGLGCVDAGGVDVGQCVPPANTPSSCNEASQFFAREAQAPWVWRATVVQDLTGSGAAAYGCSGGEHGVMFNFQYLDDESDALTADSPVTVRTAGGTTTPPPGNIARADSVAGHVGSVTAVVCLTTSVTQFAFAFDDDAGHTSNAVCVP